MLSVVVVRYGHAGPHHAESVMLQREMRTHSHDRTASTQLLSSVALRLPLPARHIRILVISSTPSTPTHSSMSSPAFSSDNGDSSEGSSMISGSV